MTKALCVVLFSILLITGLFAQEEEPNNFGVVLYADGVEISILRAGRLKTYGIFEDDVIGLVLLEGDIVQTEDNSFVEIQLFPSKNIVKLAENTIFKIDRMGTEGGGDYNIPYGRIRAQVARLNETAQFNIRSRNAVVGVRGTDFGVDYVIPSFDDLIPVLSAYCFEGSVDVASTITEAVEAPSVLIVADEMVEVSNDLPQGSSETETLTKKTLDIDIVDFWEENSIQSLPVEPSEIEAVFAEIWQDVRDARIEAGSFVVQPEDTRNVTRGELVETNLFPTIDAIDMGSLLRSVAPPEAYAPGVFGTLGGVFGIVGALTELTGVLFTFAGESLGLDETVYGTVGPALMIGGGASLGVGLLFLIIDGG